MASIPLFQGRFSSTRMPLGVTGSAHFNASEQGFQLEKNPYALKRKGQCVMKF